MRGWKVIAAIGGAAMLSVLPAQAQENAACKAGGVRPVAETRKLPPYPPMSVMTNESGTTLLLVTIGADGKPTEVQVDTSSGSLRLDEAARDHVRNTWAWTAPLAECGPGPAQTKVSIQWDLRDAREAMGISTFAMRKGDYPTESLERREQGSVVVIVWLQVGQPVMAAVVESSGFPALDKKAVDILSARSDWYTAALGKQPMTTAVFLRAVWKLD